MKQIENTLQDLKCMLIEDGYTEANIVLRTLIKAQEQVKNCSIPDVSDSVCSNCNGYGYTVDKNGRRKEHCDKC